MTYWHIFLNLRLIIQSLAQNSILTIFFTSIVPNFCITSLLFLCLRDNTTFVTQVAVVHNNHCSIWNRLNSDLTLWNLVTFNLSITTFWNLNARSWDNADLVAESQLLSTLSLEKNTDYCRVFNVVVLNGDFIDGLSLWNYYTGAKRFKRAVTNVGISIDQHNCRIMYKFVSVAFAVAHVDISMRHCNNLEKLRLCCFWQWLETERTIFNL